MHVALSQLGVILWCFCKVHITVSFSVSNYVIKNRHSNNLIPDTNNMNELSKQQQKRFTRLAMTEEGIGSTENMEEDPSLSLYYKSTLCLLEHINLNVPNHDYILDFYIHVLGMGLDPRRAQNVAKGEGTIWCNCGASQFHLPYGEEAQTIPGSIGLWYDTLEPMKARLAQYDASNHNNNNPKPFASYSIEKRGDNEVVQIQDWYGNIFYCRETKKVVSSNEEIIHIAKQPILNRSPETKERYGTLTSEKYGLTQDTTECKGISYVEFYTPKNIVTRIAEFYECVFDATTSVIMDPMTNEKVAIIAFGNIDPETGQSSQTLLFRETDKVDIPKYDGHHIALYVGENAADFEQAFKNVVDAGVLWINPRFSDKVMNLNTAKKWKQFRFKDIVDLETGTPIFELEHECRSREHEAWPGSRTIYE
jgi:predicted enzyme related to lactoylglutathione lyase